MRDILKTLFLVVLSGFLAGCLSIAHVRSVFLLPASSITGAEYDRLLSDLDVVVQELGGFCQPSTTGLSCRGFRADSEAVSVSIGKPRRNTSPSRTSDIGITIETETASFFPRSDAKLLNKESLPTVHKQLENWAIDWIGEREVLSATRRNTSSGASVEIEM